MANPCDTITSKRKYPEITYFKVKYCGFTGPAICNYPGHALTQSPFASWSGDHHWPRNLITLGRISGVPEGAYKQDYSLQQEENMHKMRKAVKNEYLDWGVCTCNGTLFGHSVYLKNSTWETSDYNFSVRLAPSPRQGTEAVTLANGHV